MELGLIPPFVNKLYVNPSFAVSNQKRESERFLALNGRHLRREKYGEGVWDNLLGFQRVRDYGTLGVR